MSVKTLPVVLCISGHDPSGGAGIQADIEAVAANGCHAYSIITCVTVQDSCDVQRVVAQPAEQIADQIQMLTRDSPIAAIKIGLLGNAQTAMTLAKFLAEFDSVPVILDPVLASDAGSPLADNQLIETIRQQLLPFTTLATPNSREARQLAAAQETLEDCARELISLGCANVLITGTHEAGPEVIHRLFTSAGVRDESAWPRLTGSFHGSGCTLASAIAAELASTLSRSAHGTQALTENTLMKAVRDGLAYTWNALDQGLKIGRCQYFPDRFMRPCP